MNLQQEPETAIRRAKHLMIKIADPIRAAGHVGIGGAVPIAILPRHRYVALSGPVQPATPDIVK